MAMRPLEVAGGGGGPPEERGPASKLGGAGGFPCCGLGGLFDRSSGWSGDCNGGGKWDVPESGAYEGGFGKPGGGVGAIGSA